MNNIRFGMLAAALLATVTVVAPASADVIDFSTVANGTAVSNQYPHVTFSMFGGPTGATTPAVSYGALNNSSDGNYPTASYLDAVFDTSASALSFVFDNEGDNSYFSNGGSKYTAFGSDGSVISTGSLASAAYQTFNVSGAGIKTLQFFNGRAAGEGSWIYRIPSLSFTAAPGAVPEPATWLMMIIGFGLIGAGMRRRVRNSNAAFETKMKLAYAAIQA